MTRRTTRTTHPGSVIRSGRGVAGYTGGVTPDELNDPAVVLPDRIVTVPPTATSPLRASGESSVGGGGGSVAATDGTTTVNPATSIQFPAGTLADLGGGVAGVGLVLQVIGPFHITHSTPDIYGGGSTTVEIAAPPTGCFVLQTMALFTEAFNGGNDLLQMNIAPAGDLTNFTGFAQIIAGGSVPAAVKALANDDAQPQRERVPIIASGDLISVFVAADTEPTAGAADIYAIIAAPAG